VTIKTEQLRFFMVFLIYGISAQVIVTLRSYAIALHGSPFVCGLCHVFSRLMNNQG